MLLVIVSSVWGKGKCSIMNMDTIYILLLSCFCVSIFGMTLTTLTQRVRKCVSVSVCHVEDWTQFLWSHHIGLCKYSKHKNKLVMNNFPWRQCEVSHSYLFCYFILVWRQRGRFLCQEGCFHLMCMVSFQRPREAERNVPMVPRTKVC